jgi:hypothetical protein
VGGEERRHGGRLVSGVSVVILKADGDNCDGCLGKRVVGRRDLHVTTHRAETAETPPPPGPKLPVAQPAASSQQPAHGVRPSTPPPPPFHTLHSLRFNMADKMDVDAVNGAKEQEPVGLAPVAQPAERSAYTSAASPPNSTD